MDDWRYIQNCIFLVAVSPSAVLGLWDIAGRYRRKLVLIHLDIPKLACLFCCCLDNVHDICGSFRFHRNNLKFCEWAAHIMTLLMCMKLFKYQTTSKSFSQRVLYSAYTCTKLMYINMYEILVCLDRAFLFGHRLYSIFLHWDPHTNDLFQILRT